MKFRSYDPKKDQEAVHRIWQEVGWLEDKKAHKEGVDLHIAAGRAMVGEIGDAAECLVLTAPAMIRYLDEDLPMSAMTGVTTSRVARKQGLATRLAAHMLALDAAEGALVAGLGMFEQGYYNRLGFGNLGYNLWVKLDPADINVNVEHRVPVRLTVDDWAKMHAARLTRPRGHGGLNILSPNVTRADMLWTKKPIGLGYFDGPGGTLSHYFWGSAEKTMHGPYEIWWIVYRGREQFQELMSLIRSLGDQVRLVELHEPPGVQMQDLVDKPFARRQISEKTNYEAGIRAAAWYQLRICNLGGCLKRTHLTGESVSFSLRLTDPVEGLLDSDAPWRGVGGDYIVTLGPDSSAERGCDPSLPILEATVNAFTRLWLGIRPATGLWFTDDLTGPPELLERLDRVLILPEFRLDWGF
jgi:hypothetical protein